MKIILIGFMGSGKSSVAAELGSKLKVDCIETDELVLSLSGRRSIKEIFSIDTEVRFREMELEVAKKYAKSTNIVVSTGGGMVLNKLCIDYLKQQGGIVVYLATSFEVIENRLKGDTTRPLFRDKVAAKKLFLFRKRLYEMYSDMKIITDNRSIEEITHLLIKKI